MISTASRIKRLLRRALFAALAGVISFAAYLAVLRPSNDRDWASEHARPPAVFFEGDRVRVENVRDFHYGPDGSYVEVYDDRVYDLECIESLWYVLAVFDGEGWRGPAHGMFSFGFEGGGYVTISVEARKEVGETYSWWRGLFKRYELIYVVGDERDLVLTRAVHRPDVVYVFPVATTPDKIRELFRVMLHKADELRESPEFYNTLTDNCTSRLRDHVNEIAPGRIPPSWKIALPGYSDELMRGLGLLEGDPPLDEARRRYMINDRARRFADAEDFSIRIRESDE